VIDNLLAAMRAEYERVVTVTICAAVIAACALVAVLFVAVAVFIWMSDHYGTVPAALALAAFFAAVALIAWGVAAYSAHLARERARQRAEERKREREEAAKNAPPAWLDPAILTAVLPIALQAVRIGIKHRGLLLALVSSATLGWAALREGREPPAPAGETAEQPAE
jgi:uncharacterized membrane protein